MRQNGCVVFDLRSLRQALLVAEHLSFRQAAAVLNVRPSSVSRRVRALEDEIGITLFERRSSGVRLTPAGRFLLERVRWALGEIEYAAASAATVEHDHVGELTVAFYQSLASGVLREILARYRALHSNVELSFIEAAPADQLVALHQRRADVAFVAGLSEGPLSIESELLWEERIHVALPEGHPIAAASEVNWADIRDQEFIVRSYESGPAIYAWLAGRLNVGGIAPAIRQMPVSRESLLGLVGTGYGLTVVSDAATALGYPGVVFRPIRDASAIVPVRMAWLATNGNPALGPFLGHARRVARRWMALQRKGQSASERI